MKVSEKLKIDMIQVTDNVGQMNWNYFNLISLHKDKDKFAGNVLSLRAKQRLTTMRCEHDLMFVVT